MTRTAPLAFLLLGLTPVAARAYYLESVTAADGGAEVVIHWDTSAPVEFRVAPSTYPGGVAGITEAIAAAFQTWSDVDCASITFTQGADETDPRFMHWMFTDDVYVLVLFSDDPAVWGSVPQVGRFDWVQNTNGELVAAEITLNSKDHAWSTTGDAGKLDVQSIVTALAGRSLGITSTMEGNATYPRYLAGDVSKQTLGTDDIAAVQYIYLEDGCAMPTDPEMICDRMAVDCPPPIMTMPGDGGTIGGADAGPIETDAGGVTRTDGGTTGADGDDDGGCCSVAAGASQHDERGAWLAIALFGILVGRRLRRRR